MRIVIGADCVEQATTERVPDRVDILAFAERRLPNPERRVGTLESLTREIEVERSRLALQAESLRLRFRERRESDARRQVHEVQGGAGLRRESRGRADRDLFGGDRTAFRAVPDRVMTGGVQQYMDYDQWRTLGPWNAAWVNVPLEEDPAVIADLEQTIERLRAIWLLKIIQKEVFSLKRATNGTI